MRRPVPALLLVLCCVLATIPAGAALPARADTASAADSAADWAWPVVAPHPIVRPFLAPATRYAAGHRGIDVGSADATVYAPADGTVHFAGVVVDRPVLSIAHADGLLSSYEPVSTALVAGTAVRRGDPVGTLLPGHCAAPCLHFGVRLDGEYVSPLLYLGGVPRSVLLPTRRLSAAAAAATSGSSTSRSSASSASSSSASVSGLPAAGFPAPR